MHIFTGFFAIFCTVWYGITLTMMGFIFSSDDADILPFALIPLVTFMVGLIPLSVLVFMIRGRAKIKIDREQLSGSIGALLLWKTVKISNHSIKDVGISQPLANPREAKSSFSTEVASCLVKSSERDMPLTSSSDAALNYQVAGLVRNHLQHVGIDLPSD